MQTIFAPNCHFVSCSKSVANVLSVNRVKRGTTRSVSCRAGVSLNSKNGQNSEERTRGGGYGRRLLLSVMSGTVLLNCLEKNSTAAEEEISDSVAPGSISSEVIAPELAVPELTASKGAAAEVSATPEAAPAGNALIQKLLARSKANKEKNDKERLDDYYRRNYKEYFEFVEGTIRNKKKEDLTEAEKGIIEWLAKNK